LPIYRPFLINFHFSPLAKLLPTFSRAAKTYLQLETWSASASIIKMASSKTTTNTKHKVADKCKSLDPGDSYKAWEERVRKVVNPLKVNERELTLVLHNTEAFEACITGIPQDGFDEEEYACYFYGSVSLQPGVEKGGYRTNDGGTCGAGFTQPDGPITDLDAVAKHLLNPFRERDPSPLPSNEFSLYIYFWPVDDNESWGDRWDEVAGRFAASKEVGPLTLPALDTASLTKVLESLHTLVFADASDAGSGKGNKGDNGSNKGDLGDDGADEDGDNANKKQKRSGRSGVATRSQRV
jgi:hypothetical protein